MNHAIRGLYFAAAASTALMVGACAVTDSRPTVPAMSDPDRAGLVIEISLKPPLSVFGNAPLDTVYFAKIDNADGPLQEHVIPSSFIRNGRAYLLNVEPGTYVAVAGSYQAEKSPLLFSPNNLFSPSLYITYFSAQLVNATRTSIPAGSVVFAGTYSAKTSVGLDGADAMQDHYKDIIRENSKGTGLSPKATYRGSLMESNNDDSGHARFVQEAKKDLAGTQWASRIR